MHSLRHLALLVILLACVPLQAAQRPNILFILTEDQGAQLGHIGTPGLQTPHMDALARSGMYFRNVFVAYPVCSASKAALYTGLHNHANGILNNTVNYAKHAAQLTPQERKHPLYLSNGVHASIPTLVERLQAAGYYQGATHKLHVAPVEKFPYDEFIRHNNRAEVAGFIARAAKTGKPWHLFYNIPNSHRPFPNSEKVQIRVKPDEVKLPAYLPDTPVVRRDWAEYLAAIEAADQVVGEGLAALRASGQEANTIIVFMGDHGPCFPHGKMTPYDLGLRVPLIIRTPSMQAGVISDALASELDLTPTLLDLLGLPADAPPLVRRGDDPAARCFSHSAGSGLDFHHFSTLKNCSPTFHTSPAPRVMSRSPLRVFSSRTCSTLAASGAKLTSRCPYLFMSSTSLSAVIPGIGSSPAG